MEQGQPAERRQLPMADSTPVGFSKRGICNRKQITERGPKTNHPQCPQGSSPRSLTEAMQSSRSWVEGWHSRCAQVSAAIIPSVRPGTCAGHCRAHPCLGQGLSSSRHCWRHMYNLAFRCQGQHSRCWLSSALCADSMKLGINPARL